MFGTKLKQLRERHGLTQEQLAKQFNTLKSSISMYEHGVRLPNAELLIDVAQYFNVSTDYLLGIEKDNTIDEQLKEQEALKNALKKAGFMKKNEDLTDEELKKLMNFVVINKEYLKGKDK
jgi:transcriptional regulator with XRE-family HTH domain